MRWVVVASLALTLAAFAFIPPAAATPGNLAVAGSGTIERFPPFVASFSFAAEQQPAHGFYTQSLSTPEGPSLFGSETVRVTCLDSLGSGDAVLGGVVSATSDPRLVVGDVFWAQIRDGRPTATPDAMSFAFVSDTPALDFGGDFPFSCATPLWSNPLPIKPLLSGQIAVADPLS